MPPHLMLQMAPDSFVPANIPMYTIGGFRRLRGVKDEEEAALSCKREQALLVY